MMAGDAEGRSVALAMYTGQHEGILASKGETRRGLAGGRGKHQVTGLSPDL